MVHAPDYRLGGQRIVDRLKKRATEATQRQREIERMYALSCSLMQANSAAALRAAFRSRWQRFLAVPAWPSSMGFPDRSFAPAQREFRNRALLSRLRDRPPGKAALGRGMVPVRLGAIPTGSLGFGDHSISAPAMQSIANLVALAMDRARKQESAGRRRERAAIRN